MREMRVSSTRRIIKNIIIGIIFLWGFSFPQVCYAQFSSDTPFDGANWELMHQEQLSSSAANLQSICCTEDYIITIENVNDSNTDPDIVSAYYKNSVDENGNPVEQYALAKRVQDTNYEHANGMAYNPNNSEIYVTLYTALDPSNRGCIFVMDPATLSFKRKIQISNDYNILGIGYKKDTDQYIIQTNSEGGYSFKILDSNFQVVEDLGEYDGTAKGSNFQDLCVDGDYIINFPLTLGYGIGDYINVYSISQKKLLSDAQMALDTQGASSDEPESICETAPGEFLATVTVSQTDGNNYMYLYKTVVPYIFHVSATSSENGTIEPNATDVNRGDNCTLTFSHDEYYEIGSLTINNSKTEIDADATSYTISNIQSDTTIDVSYVKMDFLTRVDHLAAKVLEKGLEKRIAYQAKLNQEKADQLAQAAEKEATTHEDSSIKNSESSDADQKAVNKAASATATKKKKTGPLKWILLILFLLIGSAGLYLRVVYVRRVRYLNQRKARREWERAKRIQEEDTEFEDEEL